MVAGGAWTESEKLGLLLQIIEKSCGTINYDELVLPEGRTKKACTVMIDKEKQKIRKAAQAAKGETSGADATATNAGEGDEDAAGDGPVDGAASPKKRKATGSTAGAGGKKAKKVQVKAEADEEKGLFQ